MGHPTTEPARITQAPIVRARRIRDDIGASTHVRSESVVLLAYRASDDWGAMSELTVGPDRIAAIAAVLEEQALTEKESRDVWGAVAGWKMSIVTSDSEVEAHARVRRETPEEAFADAVGLRSAILEAAGLKNARGHIIVDSVNNRDLEAVAWVGGVRVRFAMDR